MGQNFFIGAMGLAAAVFASPAHAQATDDMTAQLDVPMGCNVTATTLDFGTPTPLTTAIDANATLTVACTGTTIFRIDLDRGLNQNGSQRRLAGGSGDFVEYNLYKNALRTQDWGDTITGGLTGIVAGVGSADFTVYGRVPLLDPSTLVGNYLDTITVNVTF